MRYSEATSAISQARMLTRRIFLTLAACCGFLVAPPVSAETITIIAPELGYPGVRYTLWSQSLNDSGVNIDFSAGQNSSGVRADCCPAGWHQASFKMSEDLVRYLDPAGPIVLRPVQVKRCTASPVKQTARELRRNIRAFNSSTDRAYKEGLLPSILNETLRSIAFAANCRFKLQSPDRENRQLLTAVSREAHASARFGLNWMKNYSD